MRAPGPGSLPSERVGEEIPVSFPWAARVPAGGAGQVFRDLPLRGRPSFLCAAGIWGAPAGHVSLNDVLSQFWALLFYLNQHRSS